MPDRDWHAHHFGIEVAMSKKILVVEDDDFKLVQLEEELRDFGLVTRVQSVRDAVVSVLRNEYELVILDMALPTFTRSLLSPGGTAQAQGGMEVVRALRSRKSQTPVIIVSQYPDLEIDGEFFSLLMAPVVLTQRYGLAVVGSILFDFQNRGWVEKFREMVRSACA